MPRRVRNVSDGRREAIRRMVEGDHTLDEMVTALSSGDDCGSVINRVTHLLCRFMRIVDCSAHGLNLTVEELNKASLDDTREVITSRTNNLLKASYQPDGDY